MESSSERNIKTCLRKDISCLERKQFPVGGPAACTTSADTRMAAGHPAGSSASLGLLSAPQCSCALGLWVYLWIWCGILAGEGASVLAGHVRNAVWRRRSRSSSFCLGVSWLMQQTIHLQSTRISPNATPSIGRR